MKNFGKRITGFLIAFIMAFDFSVPAFAMELSEVTEVFEEPTEESFDEAETFAVSEGESLEDSVIRQVKAYFESINQSNADGKAADKLVAHGISGRGKKLSAGKSHPLTATLFNSGLLKTELSKGLAAAINSMQDFGIEKLPYIKGNAIWHDSECNYSLRVYYLDGEGYYEGRDWTSNSNKNFTAGKNSYDKSLVWMAGNTAIKAEISQTKITKNEVTYKITCLVYDRFDFDASAGLISGLGALLFEEFDWESKISFNVVAPNTCSHVTKNYHWTYDAENKILMSESSGNFFENEAVRMEYESSNGKITYYHELYETVNLIHDRPWVLEYDVKSPGNFVLAPLKAYSATKPCLLHSSSKEVFYWNSDYIPVLQEGEENYKPLRNYYGTNFSGLISNLNKTIYTFRYENIIDKNGSNMVYLTVFKTETGEAVLEKVPMDDYYQYKSWEEQTMFFINDSDDYLNGTDLFINYVGNENYSFSPQYFDLRIWENGKDSESVSCFEAGKTTAPTCTEKGYTTYTCSLCGYSKKADYTAALGHSLGEWETVTAPTAENPGEEQRKCKNCEHSESRVIPALGYTLSDINLDGSVDVMDAYFIRLVVAKLVEPTAKQIEIGDVDLDGKITAIDANIIRKYAIGIIKNLPIE